METIASNGVLQYGALGILFVVLVAIGKIGFDWIKSNGERVARQDEWMREMVQADKLERKEHLESWKVMVEKDIEAIGQMNAALEGVCEVLETHVKEERDHHTAIIGAIKQTS